MLNEIEQIKDREFFLSNSKKLHLVLISMMILYPLLFKTFQGIDFTDTGFYATNYQQIFSNPVSITYGFILWLSNIIGGIWLFFFGGLGLTGLKLSLPFIIYLILLVSYYTIRDFVVNKSLLLFSLLIAEIFIYSYNFPINYNNLTSFFLVLSVFFLVKGLSRNNQFLLFVSAFIAGSNIFIRMPNIVDISFITAIWLYDYLEKEKIKKTIIKSTIFLSGFISSIIIMLLIMKLLGHYDLFVEALKNIFMDAKSPESYHNKNFLLKVIMDIYLSMPKTTIKFILLAIVSAKILLIMSKYKRLFFSLTAALILFLAYYFSIPYNDYSIDYFFINIKVLTLTGAFILIVLTISMVSEKNNNYRLLIFLSLIQYVIAPMGSTNGILNTIYGMCLALPLAIINTFRFKEFELEFKINTLNVKAIKIDQQQMAVLNTLFLSVFTLYASIHSIRYSYTDSFNPLEKIYSVNNPSLMGIYTTLPRAQSIESLLNELPKFVQPNDKLLTFSEIPLLHFLTNTRPYLDGSWVGLFEPKVLKQLLTEKFQKKEDYPVAVMNRYQVFSTHWPVDHMTTLSPNTQIILDFLVQKKYKMIWSNGFFEIWLPENLKNKINKP
jgi:hypothetical protein